MVQMFARRVTFSRPRSENGEGAMSYGGRTKIAMDPLFKDVRASVQLRTTGRNTPMGLPTDAQMAIWRILIPRSENIPAGAIKNGDYASDDLGRRFVVAADYCHGMGYTLTCERMEA